LLANRMHDLADDLDRQQNGLAGVTGLMTFRNLLGGMP
jgi:hypothetical protein